MKDLLKSLLLENPIYEKYRCIFGCGSRKYGTCTTITNHKCPHIWVKD